MAPCAVLVLARPVATAADVPADPCWLSKKMSVRRAGKASKGFSRVMDAHTSQMPGSGGGDKIRLRNTFKPSSLNRIITW